MTLKLTLLPRSVALSALIEAADKDTLELEASIEAADKDTLELDAETL